MADYGEYRLRATGEAVDDAVDKRTIISPTAPTAETEGVVGQMCVVGGKIYVCTAVTEGVPTWELRIDNAFSDADKANANKLDGKSIVTALGNNNTTIPTSKAVKDVTDKLFADFAYVETGNTATKAYVKGEYLIYQGRLCITKSAISSGATFTLNTNIEAVTVGSKLTQLATAVENAGADKYFEEIHYKDTNLTALTLSGDGTIETTTVTLDNGTLNFDSATSFRWAVGKSSSYKLTITDPDFLNFTDATTLKYSITYANNYIMSIIGYVGETAYTIKQSYAGSTSTTSFTIPTGARTQLTKLEFVVPRQGSDGSSYSNWTVSNITKVTSGGNVVFTASAVPAVGFVDDILTYKSLSSSSLSATYTVNKEVYITLPDISYINEWGYIMVNGKLNGISLAIVDATSHVVLKSITALQKITEISTLQQFSNLALRAIFAGDGNSQKYITSIALKWV